MDTPDGRTVALMAIQPRFADLILAGRKRVEFRKTRFRSPVSHVVIYSTGPVGKVVGFFEVEGLDVAAPERLWERYVSVAGVEACFFESYFGAAELGVAIRIGDVFKLRSPVPLGTVSAGTHPPQSFCYLDDSALSRLERRQLVSCYQPNRRVKDCSRQTTWTQSRWSKCLEE